MAGGNAFGLVITAFASSRGHSHVRGGPSSGISRRSTSLAEATFFWRFWTTVSTLTAS